jgi:hypothetical protein
MKTIFRITKKMLDRVKIDLARPHPFAFERVGFIYVRLGTIPKGYLVLATEYQSVRDTHYVKPDPGDKVGAIINRYAITEAMQKSLNTDEGIFHVHVHDFGSYSAFSDVDLQSLNELIPSFYNISQNVLHGALLLCPKDIIGKYWTPDKVPHNIEKVSVIGHPCSYFEAAGL